MNEIDYAAKVTDLGNDASAIIAVLVTIVVGLAGFALFKKLSHRAS